MESKDLEEIIRVVVDEHAEDVGRWQANAHVTSPLYLALMKYQGAQFQVLRDLRNWIENGVVPRG
jgi:hypothetical protein